MVTLQSLRRFGLFLILLLPTLGCGGADPYATVPVSGVVTCNGKPVANGVVNFTPLPDQEGRSERGRVALGKTDSEGRFKLTTYENNDGALVGRHTVTISMGFSEESGSIAEKQFACTGSKEEVTVKRGMGEIKLAFGSKK
jgi:hypothetical protein